MGKWYVYILECADETLYTGTTDDIDERVAKHNAGKGAKYTRGRGPVKVIYTRSFKSRSEACKYEYELKQLSRVDKLGVIQSKENELGKKRKKS